MIGIDEAQFFVDLYDFCREAADHGGKTVIVAGLDGDYLRYYLNRPSLTLSFLKPMPFLYAKYNPAPFLLAGGTLVLC